MVVGIGGSGGHQLCLAMRSPKQNCSQVLCLPENIPKLSSKHRTEAGCSICNKTVCTVLRARPFAPVEILFHPVTLMLHSIQLVTPIVFVLLVYNMNIMRYIHVIYLT